MENATKALLIAAGMLLAILLLTLLVYIFRIVGENASNVYERMSESEILEFNDNFLKFENKTITIHDVITMVNFAKNNNTNYKMPANVEIILGKDNLTEYNAEKLNNLLITNVEKYYECTVEYAKNSNLINKINIKEK